MKLAEINKQIIQQIKSELKLLKNANFISTPKKNNVMSYTIKSKLGVTLIDVHYIIIEDSKVKIVKVVDTMNGKEEIWREGTIYKIISDMVGWYYSYNIVTLEKMGIVVKFKEHSIRIDKKYLEPYIYISTRNIAEIILKHYYKLYNLNK